LFHNRRMERRQKGMSLAIEVGDVIALLIQLPNVIAVRLGE
jgi:hypothetical protein